MRNKYKKDSIVKPYKKPRKGYKMKFDYHFFSGYFCPVTPVVGDKELTYRQEYEIIGDLQKLAYQDFLKYGGVKLSYEIPYENKENSKTVEFVLDYIMVCDSSKSLEISYDCLIINK